MKKWKTIAVLMVLMLVFQFTGCGSSKAADAPDDELLRGDVQDYIQEIIDENGSIKIFEKTDVSVDGDGAKAVCNVLFETSDGDEQGEFTLTYSLDGGEWKLDKCKVSLTEQEQEASASDEEATEEVTEEETEEEAAEEDEKKETKASSGSSGSMAATGNSNIIDGYSLEESGSFSDVKGIQTGYGTMFYVEDECAKIVAGNGETFKDAYVNIDDLGGGYIAVRKKSTDDVNSTGLITMDGEELIPCEAAIIERMRNRRGEEIGRYFKVVYGTGKTTDKEKAFFYTTSKNLSFSVDDGDTMYTGYARVYDSVKKQFVQGVKVENPDTWALKECGGHFIVQDKDDVSYLIDENGKTVMQTTNVQGVGNGYFLQSDEGMYKLYDETGELLMSTKDMLSDMDSTSGYLKKYENSNYVMIDKNGDKVLPDAYKMLTTENRGIVEVQTVTGEYQLVTLKGDVLASSSENIMEVRGGSSYTGTGYYYTKENDKCALIGPEGTVVSDLDEAPYHAIVFKGSDALVIHDKDYSLHLENEKYRDLWLALIAIKSDSNGKYGVFDLFTGEQLLDYEYDRVEGIEGYVYALKGETWTIYKTDYKYY